MKQIKYACVLLLCIFGLKTSAQTEIKLNSTQNEFQVLETSPYKIMAKNSLDKIKINHIASSNGNYIELGLSGYSKIYDAGKPQLPVMSRLIEIPYGAEVVVKIISYTEQEITFSDLGIPNKIIPAQASVSKNLDTRYLPFAYDQSVYQTNGFTNTPLVRVETSGIMRGVQMGNLIVSPFQYNPVSNVLKVMNDLVFEVSFKHPDLAMTEMMKEKYYSPYFQSSLSDLINYKAPQNKDVLTKYPIKYVIISPTSFQSTLQPFVRWKTKKGFKVVEQYYSTTPTAANIKIYLQGLYTNGTTADPAPTFVLLVGDVAQIPTYTGIANTAHKTDLYYCTMDGTSDYIPDMYYGRFSATTIAQLQPQIDKTLEYEQYLMPKATYLDTVVMIAGVDNGSAPDGGYSQVYGNGQINYGTTNYFNSAHGLYSYTYLWPASNLATNDVLIRNEIGTGVSFANYTAHGSSSGWADPSFQTSDVASMHNNHKYCLMVGNCCQTNTFNDAECFGEALLRVANKGALGYIGASNYSYWDEDYYFGVGSRASIVEFPTYDANKLGAYDRMFHDHGEPLSSWFYTNDQMVYAGNLAVEASTSSMKKYYWEVYHLMGDPSVMTFFSVPDPMTVTYVNPQDIGVTTLQVTTVPDAYVAISHNGTWLDAKLADASGIVNLSFPAFTTVDTADIVVTKQNKQPYIGKLYIVSTTGVDDKVADNIQLFPNPTTGDVSIKLNNTPVDKIMVLDIMGKELMTINTVSQFTTLDLSQFAQGVYLIRFQTADKFINHRIVKTR